MKRCLSCGSLRPEGMPCPGCLVELGLVQPPVRWVSVGVVAGVLGTSFLGLLLAAGLAVAASQGPEVVIPEVPVVATERPSSNERRQAWEKRFGSEERFSSEEQSENDRMAEQAMLLRERARRAAEHAAEADERAAEQQARRKEGSERAAERMAAEAAAVERAMAAESRAMEARERAEEARLRAEEAARAAALAAQRGAMMLGGSAGPSSGCADLTQLETVALLGKLSADQADCLETAMVGAPLTAASKISRMLMVDAFSRGDHDRWEQLMGRHLERIEQSDPELAFKLALHLGQKGVGRASEVIHWSDVALSNRSVWSGNTYTQRVYSLHKLRSSAAQRLWQAARDTDGESAAREQTARFALTWLEYARVGGKDTTTAMNLCMMASGSRSSCEP